VYHRCKLFVAQGVVHAGPEGGVGSRKWTTHFLVLEEAVDPVKESVEEWQQRESGTARRRLSQ
jgi:hypothetical protein